MRSRYWSADVCASDLSLAQGAERRAVPVTGTGLRIAAAVPAPVTSPFGPGVLGSFLAALVLLLLGYILWRLPSRIGGSQHADAGTPPTLSQVLGDRSETRRVGKEFVVTCISRWSPSHKK